MRAAVLSSTILAIAVVLALPAVAAAQDWVQPERTQANLDALARVEVRSYPMAQANGREIEYGVYVPTSYEGSQPTPLVVALHGLGSGVMYMMEYNDLLEHAENHGFLVVTPIGFNERGWYGSQGPGAAFGRAPDDGSPANLGELSEQDVMNVLQIARRDFNVDPDRTYLIGQSMGGGGTWHLAMKYPEIWAAVAPMAPAIYSDPRAVAAARELPVMVVMGDADQTVDVEVTRAWVAEMEALGMNYEYVEVPGGSHASAGRENIGRVFDFLARHRR